MRNQLFSTTTIASVCVLLFLSEPALACETVEHSCDSEASIPFWPIAIVLGIIYVVGWKLWDWWHAFPAISDFPSDDPRMARAKERARQTIHQFWESYADPATNEGDFGLKITFEHEFGTESIWVADISNRDGQLFGRLMNDPISDDYEIGQVIRFDESQICDWSYYRDDRLIGNYTVAVMINELSERKRKRALKEFGWDNDDLAARA